MSTTSTSLEEINTGLSLRDALVFLFFIGLVMLKHIHIFSNKPSFKKTIIFTPLRSDLYCIIKGYPEPLFAILHLNICRNFNNPTLSYGILILSFQTDLCGIKWRKFVNSERVNASSDPLDDPILRSYSRCMQADILCVWRRIPSTKQDNSDLNPIFEISTSKVHPPLSLAAAKELWIFWYGEEPDLSELVDAELLKVAGKSKHYELVNTFFLN